MLIFTAKTLIRLIAYETVTVGVRFGIHNLRSLNRMRGVTKK